MADKILMNKNTLAALKIELGEYVDALPVFEMKEQQLKGEVAKIEEVIETLQKDIESTITRVADWTAVLTDDSVDLSTMIQVKEVKTEEREIIGVTIEDFVSIDFVPFDIDYLNTPLWIDSAIEIIKNQKTVQTILALEKKKLEKLQEELSEARRMKNALKEVFIPEAQEIIRKIEIYLGDVERLAIGCAKLVKKKKQQKQVAL